MRILIQRVKEACVTVEKKVCGSIKSAGALVFLGVHKEDKIETAKRLAKKLIDLRMFSDENNKMNLSLKDINGEVLIVSQFTLYANCDSGRRPDFVDAASPKEALEAYNCFVEEVKKEIDVVQTGIFGASMEVSLCNDGPVTFLIERF